MTASKLSSHARIILINIIDNNFYDGLNITGKSVNALLKKRLHWYIHNMEGDMVNMASYYTRLLCYEIGQYLDATVKN